MTGQPQKMQKGKGKNRLTEAEKIKRANERWLVKGDARVNALNHPWSGAKSNRPAQ